MGFRSFLHRLTAPPFRSSRFSTGQVCVRPNQSLKMGKGKVAAQVGHASVQAFLNAGVSHRWRWRRAGLRTKENLRQGSRRDDVQTTPQTCCRTGHRTPPRPRRRPHANSERFTDGARSWPCWRINAGRTDGSPEIVVNTALMKEGVNGKPCENTRRPGLTFAPTRLRNPPQRCGPSCTMHRSGTTSSETTPR